MGRVGRAEGQRNEQRPPINKYSIIKQRDSGYVLCILTMVAVVCLDSNQTLLLFALLPPMSNLEASQLHIRMSKSKHSEEFVRGPFKNTSWQTERIRGV